MLIRARSFQDSNLGLSINLTIVCTIQEALWNFCVMLEAGRQFILANSGSTLQFLTTTVAFC